jgi:cell division protein ZipA
MDKELLRIVIIATGFLVMLGMIVWSFLKTRRALKDQDDFETEQVIGSSGAMDDSLRLHTEHDDFDVVPIGSAKHTLDNEDDNDWDTEFNEDFEAEETEDTSRQTLPDIIQFAIVAKDEQGFSGYDLALAFGLVGLEYGNLKVYERINSKGTADYGVACMVEPGTFPEGAYLATFSCPGIIFYLQHGNLEDAQIVFDDFVDTIKTVSKEIDGIVWDNKRQPLTEDTIQAIRQRL